MSDEQPRGRALFAYGTLLFPSVLERVLGRRPSASPAKVNGFAARTMRDATYPGMVTSATDSVLGALLDDLTTSELELLDAYEGWPYERVELDALTPSGERVRASAYVVDERHVSGDVWSQDEFVDQHLEQFLRGLAVTEPSDARDQV
jgi:gamma-glutamylcyclotransferase (GGCT)/AIG2-like uncharacterized protein YtfP